MTTSRHPEHAHVDPEAAESEEARRDGPTASGTGPWRGYTMPVPEHPEHAHVGEGSEEPSYDGIAGYPSGAPKERPDEGGAQDPAAVQPQKQSGRHARPPAEAGRERRAPREEEDPDGLAGWVGSLAEAADDTRIAGRTSGTFATVPPAARGAEGERPPARPEPQEGQVEETRAAEDTAAGPETAVGPDAPTRPGASARVPGPGPDEASEAEDDASAPLPRRVPGPSAVSGAFRAVGPNTSADEDEDEYRPTTHDRWEHTSSTTRAELIERLDALSTLVEIGRSDLPQDLTERAGKLLDHAGARLRLSAEHTVVALAGGTGSGKSSLFNALCGLELSQTGITRPTTSKAHACVWGHEGADALLSWLGVPTRYRHSRTSVLDSGDSPLTGLVLLDLPDHDSVRSMHTAEADRLIGSVDLLVWVLDPQKYADAAVHHRYLAKMAGHGAVTVAVLNQVDRVEPDELKELLTDLRRLLETESGVHPRVLTTSTVTDHGIRDLREFLAEAVGERRAQVDRLVADLDQIVEPFAEFHGKEVPAVVPEEVHGRVQEGLAEAAGVDAVADGVEAGDVRRGRRQVGWPVLRAVAKLRKDPLAAVQLDFLRKDGEHAVGGPVDAHEAELEKVLGEVADTVSEEMPDMWRRRMRAAARTGVPELPAELGEAVASAVGDARETPSWWGVARSAQYALAATAGAGLLWAVVALVSWIGGGITGLELFDDPVFLAYASALVVAALLAGWLTGVGCGNLVEVAAVQRREEVERAAEKRIREIAAQRVVQPMEAELARYQEFRASYEVARGIGG
ncbi:GTPase [Nocardiopsis algeriensis]|uniref:YfjP family GTPase n=1 Tax=Nocardiopsis algeriensis TaxID=1478215 RepID=UPI003B433CD4